MAPTTQSLSVGDGRITTRVHTAGHGDPVVFLHGAGGLEWDAFLDGLAERFTVYAPEHPGTTPGDPDGIRALDHLWDLVLYYDELFDALGLDAPAVIGHSFGGMVAAEVAATFRRRASKLVLINAIGLWRDDTPIPNFLVMTPDLSPHGRRPERAARPEVPRPTGSRVGRRPDGGDPDDVVVGAPGSSSGPSPIEGSTRIHRISADVVVWGHRDNLSKCLRRRVRPPHQGRPSRGPREPPTSPPRADRAHTALVGDFLAGG